MRGLKFGPRFRTGGGKIHLRAQSTGGACLMPYNELSTSGKNMRLRRQRLAVQAEMAPPKPKGKPITLARVKCLETE